MVTAPAGLDGRDLCVMDCSMGATSRLLADYVGGTEAPGLRVTDLGSRRRRLEGVVHVCSSEQGGVLSLASFKPLGDKRSSLSHCPRLRAGPKWHIVMLCIASAVAHFSPGERWPPSLSPGRLGPTMEYELSRSVGCE